MIFTREERREVAKKLRGLDTHDWYDYADEINSLQSAIECNVDQRFESQRWWHRLADLIDPVCTPVVDDVYGMPDELVCSECGCCLAITVDGKPSAPLSRYCPCCGARIVEEL